MLQIFITQISPTHHRFEYKRKDGTGESSEIETKSFLIHDFVHFVLETQAEIQNGFYGLLDQGYSYNELSVSPDADLPTKEALNVERIVGPLSSFLEKTDTQNIDSFLSIINNMFDSYEEPVPEWLTKEILSKTITHYKQLKGEWRSLSFGKTLELEFGK